MNSYNFDEIYYILNNSFEPYLHRGYDKQKNLLTNNSYNLIVQKIDNKVVGFLSYWCLKDNLLFVEHFAVDKNHRGYGIGKSILSEFLNLAGDKILEVEPPENDVNKSRIEMYKKFGFIFNEYDYFQPSYNGSSDKIKLHLMTTSIFTLPKLNDIKNIIYKKVYNYTNKL